MDLYKLIDAFFLQLCNSDMEIYNEFSLQHELGIYLRIQLPEYKVQFERNISYFDISKKTIKKEIDITIFNNDKTEVYSIELKYPRNGQYPEQLFSFTKDLIFAEELKKAGFTRTYAVTLVDDIKFCGGTNINGIYGYYRNYQVLSGRIYRPTGKTKDTEFIEVTGSYHVNWVECGNRKYYILEAQ